MLYRSRRAPLVMGIVETAITSTRGPCVWRPGGTGSSRNAVTPGFPIWIHLLPRFRRASGRVTSLPSMPPMRMG